MKFVLLSLAVVALSSAFVVRQEKKISPELEALSGIELVEYVNKAQNLFTAKMNPYFARFPEEVKMKIMGVKNIEIPAEDRINEMTHNEINDDAVPDSFDARTAWPACPSIANIRDQSACGSCWAFGAAEAISDRICIASNGKNQLTISADDIMSCCGKACGNGCEGGYPIQAWKHWVSEGYVTGGAYGSNNGCKPYPFPPCEHHDNATRYQPCQSALYPNDKCVRTCESSYGTPYQNDIHFGASAYAVSKKVAHIQKEIMTNGPVEVGFTVYEDFETYTGGVYVHTAGKQLGGHAVKMIGWGVDNGTPYWLCTNSWNSDWGEQGYFRIIRGVNECGIEGGVVGGLPKL